MKKSAFLIVVLFSLSMFSVIVPKSFATTSTPFQILGLDFLHSAGGVFNRTFSVTPSPQITNAIFVIAASNSTGQAISSFTLHNPNLSFTSRLNATKGNMRLQEFVAFNTSPLLQLNMTVHFANASTTNHEVLMNILGIPGIGNSILFDSDFPTGAKSQQGTSSLPNVTSISTAGTYTIPIEFAVQANSVNQIANSNFTIISTGQTTYPSLTLADQSLNTNKPYLSSPISNQDYAFGNSVSANWIAGVDVISIPQYKLVYQANTAGCQTQATQFGTSGVTISNGSYFDTGSTLNVGCTGYGTFPSVTNNAYINVLTQGQLNGVKILTNQSVSSFTQTSSSATYSCSVCNTSLYLPNTATSLKDFIDGSTTKTSWTTSGAYNYILGVITGANTELDFNTPNSNLFAGGGGGSSGSSAPLVVVVTTTLTSQNNFLGIIPLPSIDQFTLNLVGLLLVGGLAASIGVVFVKSAHKGMLSPKKSNVKYGKVKEKKKIKYR